MISYNLAPIPIWCLNDRQGRPLTNGYMKAFRDTVRSDQKAVYSDSSGLSIYTQPIFFNAEGRGPFYWASDENYYLEIYDKSNNIIWTVPGYNAPSNSGSTPITNNIDFTNFIRNTDFYFNHLEQITPVALLQLIASGGWAFRKSNTSADDEINFVKFNLGDTIPPFNPFRYFNYECTVAGSGETYKDLEFRIPRVRSLEGQQVTIGFWASSTTVANTVELIIRQHFGTGGAPSPDIFTSVTSFNLTSDWEQYSSSTVIPSVGGESLGTNAEDFISINWRMPLDAETSINITHAQLNLGNSLLPFDYLTPQLAAASIIPVWIPGQTNLKLVIGANGLITWEPI